MTEPGLPKPPIASPEEWRAARIALLEREKAHTREMDAINAQRRRLPMVKVDKEYTFDTPEGKKSLLDLFEGKRQLIVYHFMFDPAWDKGCPGCTSWVNALGDLSDLGKRDTAFVLVSRAPLEKLEKYRSEKGWDWKWVSSFDSDFNFDYNVSLTEEKGTKEYNYRPNDKPGEAPGTSVFFRDGDEIYHTYSTYARGGENTVHSYALLDLTPYGRQEDFEDSPEGFPQKPTYG